jgi:hypothetical protein
MRVVALLVVPLVACGSNSTPPPTPPPAPIGLSVTTTDTSAVVQWAAAPGATGYDVLRDSSAVGSVTGSSVSDSGLAPNTTYTYSVRAKNAAGTSPAATVVATTAPQAPGAVSVASISNHHLGLSWTAPPNAGTGGYRILRATSAGGPYAPVGTTATTTFTDTFLANGTPYFYVVHTIGGSGESGDSMAASGTPFIEICTVDSASYRVSVFDGTANGNVAPKRSFGWSTGIAEGTGIGTDGTNVYVASRYTQTVNVYPRATASGDQAPARTLTLAGQPTALTVDASNSELYVAVGNQLLVFATSATGSATPSRKLTLPGGASKITGIQVFSGTTSGGTVTVNDTFVVADNTIYVYANGAKDNPSPPTPTTSITPAGTNTGFTLVGPAYDSNSDSIWVGWYDYFGLSASVSSYSRTASGVTNPVQPPLVSGPNNPYFDTAKPGGVLIDGTDLWVVVGGASVTTRALVKYTASTATGGAQASGGFTGALTKIYQPGALTLDAGSNELWLVNGKNGASGFLKTATPANHAPAHALLGDSTGLYDPAAIGVSRPSGQIVVLNQSPGHAISVYPLTQGSPVTPARQIAGGNTTLDAMAPSRLAIDEVNGEYWVDDGSSNSGFAAFAAVPGGNVAPAREIFRSVSLGTLDSMFYDSKASQIVGTLSASANTLAAWNRTDSGNVPPDRSATVSSAVLTTPAVDSVHDLLFALTDSGVISMFPRAFSSGPLTATSMVTSTVAGGLVTVDGEGDELYFFASDRIIVAPRPTGTSLSPSRTIMGSATGFATIAGLAICN